LDFVVGELVLKLLMVLPRGILAVGKGGEGGAPGRHGCGGGGSIISGLRIASLRNAQVNHAQRLNARGGILLTWVVFFFLFFVNSGAPPPQYLPAKKQEMAG